MHLIDSQLPGEAPRAKTSRVGSAIFAPEGWQSVAASLRLSPREKQIVQGVFDNHKENEIAGNLQISPHTVHTYLERLYHKLGVSGRVQLVVMVADAHINRLDLHERSGEPARETAPRASAPPKGHP
jgi:DNA-binding CsgD family transcriptional regulator